jgi:hypothetical protein
VEGDKRIKEALRGKLEERDMTIEGLEVKIVTIENIFRRRTCNKTTPGYWITSLIVRDLTMTYLDWDTIKHRHRKVQDPN